MRLLRYIRSILFITAAAVLYTHLQMVIIDLAYQGKEKEQQILKLKEDSQDVTSKILAMESSNNLGNKLLAENSDMQFIHPEDIIQIPSSQMLPQRIKGNVAQNSRPNLSAFLNSFFHFSEQSVTKTAKE